jgi:cytochrome P450
MTPVRYDPYDAEVMRDPHPVYRRLRDEDPVHRIEGYDAWAVSRMEDVWSCFARPEVLSNTGGITAAQLLQHRMAPYVALGNLDPPVHTGRRGAVKPWFSARQATEQRGVVQEVCRARLAELREAEGFDAVVDYGLHLSVTMVCELLAIPTSDRPLLTDWVRQIFYRTAEEAGLTAAGADAYEQILRYCAEHASARRRQPRGEEDLLGRYLALDRGDGRALDEDEVASHLREMVIGGSETNPKVLAAALNRLWLDPAQRAEVAADRALVPKAFDEALRIDTPGQFMGRLAIDDVELGGRHIAKGDVVLLLVASANRDDREFAAPDTFDVHRPAHRTVGYGSGPHFCIGRNLAGVEGDVALHELLAVAPEHVVHVDRATRANHEMVHGFTSLPVTWA